jgi:hypothetical protein
MTKQEAKNNGFTHKGVMYDFIPVYCTDDFEPNVTGINMFWDKILELTIRLDLFIGISEGFDILLKEEL